MISATQDIEGITISGGEPFEQAAAVADLTEIVRGTGLTVMCYSGFTLAELKQKKSEDVQRLLENIDVLVDGRFIEAKAEPLRWRGSSNQKIHWLSGAYEDLRGHDDRISDVELITSDDAFTATGIWPPGFLDLLNTQTRDELDDSTENDLNRCSARFVWRIPCSKNNRKSVETVTSAAIWLARNARKQFHACTQMTTENFRPWSSVPWDFHSTAKRFTFPRSSTHCGIWTWWTGWPEFSYAMCQ